MVEHHSVVGEKAKHLAIAVVRLFKNHLQPQKEFVLSKQFLRSSTSIGANISEATGSYSKKDFGHKMSIAYKEARESAYWLEILHESGYIADNDFNELSVLLTQINKMLFCIVRTSKKE